MADALDFRFTGQQDLLDRLLKDEKLTANKTAKEGLDDMATFLKYLTIFGVLPRVSLLIIRRTGLSSLFTDLVRPIPCTWTRLLHWRDLRMHNRSLGTTWFRSLFRNSSSCSYTCSHTKKQIEKGG